MRKFLYYPVIVTLTITIQGCGGPNTESHAVELCNCMKDIGIDETFRTNDLNDWETMRRIERKAQRVLPECALGVMRKIEVDIADLSKNEKKEYTKSLVKDILDTDCSEFVLDQVPFDMLGIVMDELEEETERSKKRQYQDLF